MGAWSLHPNYTYIKVETSSSQDIVLGVYYVLLLQRPTFPPLGFLLQDIDDPFDALLEPLVHLGVAAIHSLLTNHSWIK